jgi:hypothetical protein
MTWFIDHLDIHDSWLHFADHWHTQSSVLSLLQPPVAVSWQRLSEHFPSATDTKAKMAQQQRNAISYIVRAQVLQLYSVVLVRKRTIPTKRPQPADEVSANFSW